MNPTHAIVEGTLKPDGSLELTEKLPLPAGRVRVTVELVPEPTAKGSGLDGFFEQLRQNHAARGFVGRSKEEIDAEINAMRDEWEDRMQEIERLREECRRAREDPAC